MVRAQFQFLVCFLGATGVFATSAHAQATPTGFFDSRTGVAIRPHLDLPTASSAAKPGVSTTSELPNNPEYRALPNCPAAFGGPALYGTGVSGPFTLDGMADGCPSPGASSSAAALLHPAKTTEKMHWRPLFTQSFEFLLMEHGFRLADGGYTRYLLMHKPFFQDWANSLQHFDMDRWGDGDPFIVNYIGHPMEGAVSGDIFIQNDPQGRMQRFGKSSGYWNSRMRAMGWAALYSAYFEVGPFLSEAAIGNEGGYTYVPGCGNAPCAKHGQTFKPPTNNTGWVDFVVTPTIGMGWIILEDALEAKLVDKLQGDDNRLRWKILRGSLSPSRSLANILQWKPPWYRPWYDHDLSGDLEASHSATPLEPVKETASADYKFRKAIGIHYVNLSLPMDYQGCKKCRVSNSGFGANFDYRMTKHLWFDSELNYFPGSGGEGQKGSATEGLFGLRYGFTGRVWNLYAKVRPGFIYYSQTTSYPTGNQYVSLARFAVDCGTVLEMKTSERSVLRIDAGTTFVRYLQGLDPQQPSVAVISPNYIATQGNFQMSTGYVYRF